MVRFAEGRQGKAKQASKQVKKRKETENNKRGPEDKAVNGNSSPCVPLSAVSVAGPCVCYRGEVLLPPLPSPCQVAGEVSLPRAFTSSASRPTLLLLSLCLSLSKKIQIKNEVCITDIHSQFSHFTIFSHTKAVVFALTVWWNSVNI